MTVATKVNGDDDRRLDLGEGVERWIGERFHVGQGGRSLSYIGEIQSGAATCIKGFVICFL